MLAMSAKFWSARGPKALASPRTLRKHCRASAGKLFFRRDISPGFTATCAERARSASPTKCKSASGDLGRISGDSRRKGSSRISSFWANRSAMAFHSPRRSPRLKSPIRSTMGWSFSARLAAILWRAQRAWQCWMFSKKKTYSSTPCMLAHISSKA